MTDGANGSSPSANLEQQQAKRFRIVNGRRAEGPWGWWSRDRRGKKGKGTGDGRWDEVKCESPRTPRKITRDGDRLCHESESHASRHTEAADYSTTERWRTLNGSLGNAVMSLAD